MRGCGLGAGRGSHPRPVPTSPSLVSRPTRSFDRVARQLTHAIGRSENGPLTDHSEGNGTRAIGGPLPSNVADVVDRIERLEKCSGEWNQGRRYKNMVPWFGYRYRIKGDPQEYWVRCGENWCTTLNDWGEYGKDDGPDIDLNILLEFNQERENVFARVCGMECKAAVAYLLRLVIGV